MPPEGVLPVCPRAIATARPGRESWALEELLDAVAPDPKASVVRTGYRGVFAIYSDLPVCRLASLFMGWEYSFVRSIIVACRCGRCDSALSVLEGVVGGCPRSVGFLVRVRGECKRLVDVRGFLVSRGLVERRRSRDVVAVESVGDWFMACCGRVVERPFGTVLVVPRMCKT